jgi:hypothetical protein
MTTRTLTAAVLTLLGFGSINTVAAQPVAPPRPSYSPYLSYTPSWGSGFYGNGTGGNTWSGRALQFQQFQQFQQQNVLMQQQINQVNQSLTNFQTFAAYGIDPNMGLTGRGATFNYLGHWYPSSRYGSGGGGGMMGAPLMASPGLGSFPGSGFPGGGLPGGAAPGGANIPRTAGSGIPVGQPKR